MLAALFILAATTFAQSPTAFGTSAVLTANEVSHDEVRHLAIAKGNALLRIGSLTLRSDEIHYREDTHRFEIPGPLFGADHSTLILGQSAKGALGAASTDPGELMIQSVRIEDYKWLPPDAATRFRTADEIRVGRVLLMAVEGNQLRRLGPNHYELDGVKVSPCACTGSAKCRLDWALAARTADVHAGDYALLESPGLEIAGFPVPLLRAPALYIPLSQRRTGFLLPHLLWQSQNGLLFDEPFYLTLGRSSDLTLSAGYITGAAGVEASGVQGPRASAEFRYAPSDDTVGRLFLSIIDDRHTDPDFVVGQGAEVRGARGSLHAIQVQNLAPRDGDRFDLNLVSDARLTGQLTTDLLFAQIPATRSAAFAFHRSDDWVLTLDGVFLQDFEGDFPTSNVHGLLFGPGAPKTIERLPALTLDLPDRPIDLTLLRHTPLRYSLALSLLREGPLGSAYDSLALASAPAYSLVPSVSVARARSGVEQFDAVPTLSFPFQAGQFATGALLASWRQDLWLFENNPIADDLSGAPLSPLGARGYPLFDATLQTQLARAFGQGDDRIRHTIAPEIEVRSIPFQLTAGTVAPLWLTPSGQQIFDHSTGLLVAQSQPLLYDEISEAAGLTTPLKPTPGSLVAATAPGAITQGQLHIDQRLRTKAGELARLDVGENFDGGGLEQTWVLGAFHSGLFHLTAFGDWNNRPLPCPGCHAADRALRQLTEAFVDTGLADGRGDALGLGLNRAIAAGAPQLSAPIDLLFAQRPTPTDPRWALPDIDQLSFGGTLQIAYGLNTHLGAAYQLAGGAFSQVQVGIGYVSQHHCCTLDLNAVLQPPAPGQLSLAAVFLSLDLGELAGGTQAH